MFKVTITFGLIAVIISVATAFDFPPEIIKAAKKIHNSCRDKNNVEESLLMRNVNEIVSDEREFQCYIDCLFRTIEVIDDDGKINFEKIHYLLPEEALEVVQLISEKCGTIHGKDGCETAWLTAKCYFEADPKVKKFTQVFV